MFSRNIVFAAACGVLLVSHLSFAQTISLSSSTSSITGAASLNLTLAAGGNTAAALQWTLQFPASSVSAISATAGPAVSTAGKSLSCVPGNGSYNCIAYGMNGTAISDGVIAVVALTVTQSTAITVTNVQGVSPSGSAISLTTAGGTVTMPPVAPKLTGLSCAPTTLSGASSTACSVTLSGPAPASTTISLSSNNTAVILPQSVTVLPGSSSGQFTAVSSGSINATATITATLNGASTSMNLALTTGTFSLRVHPGGASYVDPDGYTWSADTGYTGGIAWSTGNTIANTKTVPLYQTVRYGNFGYHFTVPNGVYLVNLKFAEVSQNKIGDRVFSVALNGNVVLPNFDVIAAAGGPLVAVDKSFPVTVTNGSIQIGFLPGAANLPMVNAIEIVQQGGLLSSTSTPLPTTFSPANINSGGPAYTDAQGKVWTADADFTGGASWSTAQTITNTAAPKLYQTCRYGQFYYQIPLPNGHYMILLKFAEISRSGAGQRIFNVQINGSQVLTNFDINGSVGAPFIASDQTFSATVTNGVLVLGFTPVVDQPLVSAIQVVSAN